MRATFIGICGAALAACLLPSNAHAEDRSAFERPLVIPFPEDAPYSPLQATLGKMLFFDPRLSSAQNMSCASCHNPSFGWEVAIEGPVGAHDEMLPRQAPTILNSAWLPHFFWDGRAASLEEQAQGPITAALEMNARLDQVVERLGRLQTYRDGFERAFPGEGLTEETLLRAIATYERTVVSGWAPFDRWVEGDEDAISESAKRGFGLFVGEAGCAECHAGWNFTDHDFHDIGLPSTDVGRAAQAPADPRARFAFKTPSLRNIAHRAPYMHDGSLPDLESVVAHYVGGGASRLSRLQNIRPLDLDHGQVRDLVAFLETLTADESAVPAPVLPVD